MLKNVYSHKLRKLSTVCYILPCDKQTSVSLSDHEGLIFRWIGLQAWLCCLLDTWYCSPFVFHLGILQVPGEHYIQFQLYAFLKKGLMHDKRGSLYSMLLFTYFAFLIPEEATIVSSSGRTPHLYNDKDKYSWIAMFPIPQYISI